MSGPCGARGGRRGEPGVNNPDGSDEDVDTLEVCESVFVVAALDELPHASCAQEDQLPSELHADHLVEFPVESRARDDDVVDIHADGAGVFGVRRVALVPSLEARDVIRVGRETFRLLVGETGVLRHLLGRDATDRDADRREPLHTVPRLDALPDDDVAAGIGRIELLGEGHDDLADHSVETVGIGQEPSDVGGVCV